MTNEQTVGKAKGALALAAKLTPEQRRQRARNAALARWTLKATHRGNFQQAFGIDVDCYVLDDARKTAVISQRGMGVALGLGEGGRALPRFVQGKKVAQALGAEILDRVSKPLIFKVDLPGLNATVHGYEVGLLIDICRALVVAQSRGELLSSHANIVARSNLVLAASAKSGIQSLVYALAGYDQTKEEVIEAYKRYVREEAREYEKEFSPELYEQWYRLYGLAKPDRGRPWEFRYLTIDHIYWPLANSSGKVLDLARANKAGHGDGRNKIHQFLSEVGVKALRTQIGKIIGIATVSKSREDYEANVEQFILKQTRLPF